MGEEVDIFLGQLLPVHLLDAVDEQTAVQADESLLRQFADEGRDVLVFDVGIGVKLGAGGGVLGNAVVRKELHLFKCLAVFGMLLAVDDEAFCYFVEAFFHQCRLHLVLDVLYFDVVLNVQIGEDFRHGSQVGRFVDTLKCLENGIHDLVEGEPFLRPVAFGNCEVLYFHCFAFVFRRRWTLCRHWTASVGECAGVG